MSTALGDAIFWIAALAIVVAQAMILRSTRRGMRNDRRGTGSAREWAYAILPAVALAVVLVSTWQRMHPATLRFHASPTTTGVGT